TRPRCFGSSEITHSLSSLYKIAAEATGQSYSLRVRLSQKAASPVISSVARNLLFLDYAQKQIPRLRYAPLGMTVDRRVESAAR
ncbi:hypothetical protein LCGC14_2180090, partial [marine sediment metagenome]